LGAGVSYASGLPSWPELIRRLCQAVDQEHGQELFDVLIGEQFSLPVLASLVRRRVAGSYGLDAQLQFAELVRRSLYTGFPYYPGGVDFSNRRDFVHLIDSTNPTLRAVSALCAEPGGTKRVQANSHLQAVVTLNLDHLLQIHSRAKYFPSNFLRTIERPSERSAAGKLNIYHMHGFIRFDRKAGQAGKEAPDQLVLTEQDYFEAFNNPTRIFNYTFLFLLREYTALFVGTSMNDQNLRRLLYYSNAERLEARRAASAAPHAYPQEETQQAQPVPRHIALLPRPQHSVVADAFEASLGALGVQVLWLNSDFSDLAAIFEQIYESEGGAWSTVY
jgi:hypothetical protein